MSREPSGGQKLNLLDRLAWLYATGCGIGMAPKAPGTFGSLLGPLLVWSWQSLARPMHESVIVSLVGVLLGVGAAQRTARRCGLVDPGCVVCDEIAAFAIVFALTPVLDDRNPRLRVVSSVRYRETVADQPARTFARRLGHHGRRLAGWSFCCRSLAGNAVDARIGPLRSEISILANFLAERSKPRISRITRMFRNAVDRIPT